MLVYYLFKFLRLWGVFASITLLFSILVSLSCNNIYKVSGKNAKQLLIPGYNLMNLLDIVKMNRMNFILFILPVVNVLLILIILYRLSIVFHTNKFFAFGLILLPIIFLPILNFGNKLDNRSKEEIDKEEYKKSSYNMLTEEELKNLNSGEEEKKVDNVFKKSMPIKEEVPVFKANKIKYDSILLSDDKKEVKDVKNVEIDKINDKLENESEQIEIVEL